MGLYIATEDIGNQISYQWSDAEQRITGLTSQDAGIGFDENFQTLIDGVRCIKVTYIPTLQGPINDRLNVLINNNGFDHNNLVNYLSPPDIVILAIDDTTPTPTQSPIDFGLSLPQGPPNPFSNNVCLVYNTVHCIPYGGWVAKAGGGQTSASPTDHLYHQLALCFKYVTTGDITDETQATIDENEWRAVGGEDPRDINDHSAGCFSATNPNPNQTTNNGGCFPASTPILTPRGWVRIGDLREGDLVVSYARAAGRTRIRTVTRRLDHAPAQIWEIALEGTRDVISTTASHPFLTQRGWIFARRLESGDLLITLEGPKRVGSIRKTDRLEAVHNLFTTGEHTFIVQGHVVAHNFAYLRALRLWWHRWLVDWRWRIPRPPSEGEVTRPFAPQFNPAMRVVSQGDTLG